MIRKILKTGRNNIFTQMYWVIVFTGIAPTVVGQMLLPFDWYKGFWITDISTSEIYRSNSTFFLILFSIGFLICAIRRNTFGLFLLVPPLVAIFINPEVIDSRLPSYADVQSHILYEFKELETTAASPSIGGIKKRLSNVKMPPFISDKMTFGHLNYYKQLKPEAKLSTLNEIEDVLHGENPELQERIEKLSSNRANIISQIGNKKSQLTRLDNHIKLIAGIFMNLANPVITKQRAPLVSEISTLQESVSKIDIEISNVRILQQNTEAKANALNRLRKLQAELTSYEWVSSAMTLWLKSISYKLFCFLTFILFIVRNKLASLTFLGGILATAAIAVVSDTANSLPILWIITELVAISVVIKILTLFVTENWPILRKHSTQFLIKTTIRATKYYLPIIVAIVIGLWISNYLESVFDKYFYSSTGLKNSNQNKITRRMDVDISIEKYFDLQEREGRAHLTALSRDTGTKANEIPAKTVGIYKNMFKPQLDQIHPVFELPRCNRWYHWVTKTGNCVENMVKEPMHDWYRDSRENRMAQLKTTTELYAKEGNNETQATIEIAKRDLTKNLLTYKTDVKINLNYTYSVIDTYSWIAALIVIAIALKSFLYIFARVFFTTQDKSSKTTSLPFIQFEPAENVQQAGVLEQHSDIIRLDKTMGDSFFVSKQHEFRNATPTEATPQLLMAVFSRIKNKTWHLNKVIPSDNIRNTPSRVIPDNERVIEWKLKPGDEVIFPWSNFVAMSNGVRISSNYSWQLASLIFGRMYYIVASIDENSDLGGTIFLQSVGDVGIDSASNPSNSPDQLLTWQTTTRFTMKANVNFRDLYRSGVQIKAFDNDLSVMHLSNNQNSRSGASRFFKYFLLPW